MELLDPTMCKCTGLVGHCVFDCVAMRRVKYFFFLAFTHMQFSTFLPEVPTIFEQEISHDSPYCVFMPVTPSMCKPL